MNSRAPGDYAAFVTQLKDFMNLLADAVTVFTNLLTSLAIMIGGLWAVWKFVIRRESYPKVQFSVGLNVIGVLHDRILVDVVAVLENKGLVRHEIRDLQFEIRYLPTNGKIVDGGKDINHQVFFEELIEGRVWIPKHWNGTFVDPGVVQRYSYIASLPSDTAFALLRARFEYPDAASEFHSAQMVFDVRQHSGL